jgi:hypothetical protein
VLSDAGTLPKAMLERYPNDTEEAWSVIGAVGLGVFDPEDRRHCAP